ncbi:hypothetical protein [Dysgonomonas sp. HDW5B]|uniref:hypothetical protein n=1 Tax=Dysgonomonas sp. HDW5B TaxID=2714927 RepID=UPI0016250BDA|nr:hypothetical protein [Dysgonomonas sp. HDW5B]
MKTDLYTKTVLTVIAVCLTVNLLKEFEIVPTAKASTATDQTSQPTAIKNETVDVNISQIGGVPITNHNPRNPEHKPFHKEFNLYYEGIPITVINK